MSSTGPGHAKLRSPAKPEGSNPYTAGTLNGKPTTKSQNRQFSTTLAPHKGESSDFVNLENFGLKALGFHWVDLAMLYHDNGGQYYDLSADELSQVLEKPTRDLNIIQRARKLNKDPSIDWEGTPALALQDYDAARHLLESEDKEEPPKKLNPKKRSPDPTSHHDVPSPKRIKKSSTHIGGTTDDRVWSGLTSEQWRKMSKAKLVALGKSVPPDFYPLFFNNIFGFPPRKESRTSEAATRAMIAAMITQEQVNSMFLTNDDEERFLDPEEWKMHKMYDEYQRKLSFKDLQLRYAVELTVRSNRIPIPDDHGHLAEHWGGRALFLHPDEPYPRNNVGKPLWLVDPPVAHE